MPDWEIRDSRDVHRSRGLALYLHCRGGEQADSCRGGIVAPECDQRGVGPMMPPRGRQAGIDGAQLQQLDHSLPPFLHTPVLSASPRQNPPHT